MNQRPGTQAEINEFRRRSMIDATLRSLAENGVSGTTVRSICGGSAGSRGLIAHYYKNKEELLAAAFLDLMQSLTGAVRRAQQRCDDDPLSQLKALPRAMFSPKVFTEINRGAILAFWHEMGFNQAVRKANHDMYRNYFKDVEQMFALASQTLDIDIDTSSAAHGLIAIIDGLWLRLSIDDREISRKSAAALCCNYIDQQFK